MKENTLIAVIIIALIVLAITLFPFAENWIRIILLWILSWGKWGFILLFSSLVLTILFILKKL
jgi:hypothetical protein